MLDAYRDPRTGQVCVSGRLALPRFEIRDFILFQLDDTVDSTVLVPGDVVSLEIPWRDCPAREAPVVVDGHVLECRETEAVIFLTDDRGRFWGYRTRVAILPPVSSSGLEEAALSRLGRDIRRRLRVEQGEGDDVLITPVSADFEDDLGDQR